jgi:hypothetical protein
VPLVAAELAVVAEAEARVAGVLAVEALQRIRFREFRQE